ncbi:MAG: hypothetical protein AB7K52_11830 [Phycisphaerales bacterium]
MIRLEIRASRPTPHKGRDRTQGRPDEEQATLVRTYFLEKLLEYNERTRGDILATVDGALFQLNREPFRQLLDSPKGCSFFPESVPDKGAVIVIDIPASTHGAVGRMISICFKRLFKEAFKRRKAPGDHVRPVLHFCDEAQTYLTKDDALRRPCRTGMF